MSFFKKKPLALLATLTTAVLPLFALASNPICDTPQPTDPLWLSQCFANTPATLLPANKEIYYGRSTLPKAHQLVYDHILNHAGDWGDSTQMSSVYPVKTIDLSMLPEKITSRELNYLLVRMRDDVTHLYTQRPAARNVITDMNGRVLRFDFRYTNKPLYDQYVEELSQIEEAVKPILAKVMPNMTEAQKVRVLHDEFLKMASYGQLNTLDPDTISGAFISKVIICEGYAEALSYLLNLAGIKSTVVFGDADGTSHAWNKVFVEGAWYNIDPTWNDGMMGSSHVSYDYFLKADKNFTDHVPESLADTSFALTLPTENLATEDYPLANTEYTPKPHQPSSFEEVPQALSLAIFSEEELAGDVNYLTQSVSQLSAQMDNNLSSFYIPEGWVVKFFEKANFQGKYYTLTHENAHNADVFDNKISSIQILTKNDLTAPNSTPLLYTEEGQQGEAVRLVSNMAKLDSELINNIHSFFVPEGWTIRFYEQANFQGPYYSRNQSSNQGFDKVGSIRVIAKPSKALAAQDQHVTLYSQANFEGEKVTFTTDTPNLDGVINSAINSILVPAGWQVRFYEDENYQGTFYTRDSETNQNAFINFDFDFKVRSVRVLRKPNGAILPNGE